MEQKLPIVAKKFWKMVRVVYFMLRRGFSKAKMLANMNSMLRRGKIAGKAAIHGLLPHHAATVTAASARHQHSYPAPLDEYEFSCSDSPAYPNFLLPFHLSKRKRATHAPPQCNEGGDLFAEAIEMVSSQSLVASPALPGFGRTPMARQLRITDSPFPVAEGGEDAQRVDEAAEKFILKFYRELRQQN